MPREYSIAHVRDHLSEVVHEAEAGEKITLTRRGKPVAVLLSQQQFDRLRGEGPGFWNAYQSFRETLNLESFGIDRKTLADLRDKSPGRKVSL